MIALLTDFGLEGPYIGQVKAVLLREAPGVPVVDLFADLPPFNPKAAAYLLPAYAAEFLPGTVFVCVVDPGVGSERGALVVKADGHWFVGPDNGLFEIVGQRAEAVQRWRITFKPARLSASFHGRDLFAPVAAQLAMGAPVPGDPIEPKQSEWKAWPEDLYEVVYIDHYGNAMTGVRASTLGTEAMLGIRGRRLPYARTFSEVQVGQPFWYENANGLVEFALREGSFTATIGVRIGDAFTLEA